MRFASPDTGGATAAAFNGIPESSNALLSERRVTTSSEKRSRDQTVPISESDYQFTEMKRAETS
jgi:hypothetical protein